MSLFTHLKVFCLVRLVNILTSRICYILNDTDRSIIYLFDYNRWRGIVLFDELISVASVLSLVIRNYIRWSLKGGNLLRRVVAYLMAHTWWLVLVLRCFLYIVIMVVKLMNKSEVTSPRTFPHGTAASALCSRSQLYLFLWDVLFFMKRFSPHHFLSRRNSHLA